MFFYVKNTCTGRYVKDASLYIQNSLMHPIKSFESFAEARAVARRFGWGYIVTNSVRIC